MSDGTPDFGPDEAAELLRLAGVDPTRGMTPDERERLRAELRRTAGADRAAGESGGEAERVLYALFRERLDQDAGTEGRA